MSLLGRFCFPTHTELSVICLSLAGWRQRWRSCRTAAGQQIPLCFLHPAGMHPRLGNIMVQSRNFMTPVCICSVCISLIHCIVWKIKQKNRRVINKLPQLLSSHNPSLSGDCCISLSSLVSKTVWALHCCCFRSA